MGSQTPLGPRPHSGSFSFGASQLPNTNAMNPQSNSGPNTGLFQPQSFGKQQSGNNQNQNLFNSNSGGQQQTLFGANTSQNQQSGPQPFGLSTPTQSLNPSSNPMGNLFGQPKTQETTGIFGGLGNPSTQKPLFGQTAPNNQSTSINLFGNQGQNTGNPSSNLFSGQPSTPTPGNQNIFGIQQNAQPTNQPLFGFQNNQQKPPQSQFAQTAQENQAYFQPNAIFAFNNFAPKTSRTLTILDNHKLIQSKEEQEKLAQYNFLFQVEQNAKLELSELNKLSQTKISELDPKYSSAIKALDEQIRNNYEKLKKMKESLQEMEAGTGSVVAEQIRSSAL